MDDQGLLQTKLFKPLLPEPLLPRSHLLAWLDTALVPHHGWQRRLTLISAPAGYGKTTLAASWAAATGMSVAWLTLDEADNSLPRFLTYLGAALERAGLPPVDGPLYPGEQTAPGREEANSQRVGQLLTSVLNAALAVDRPVLIVLDDYHRIHQQPIHDAVTFLLDHMPPQLHLMLLTRADPPLPIARLRARQQLLELRQADLCFSAQEVEALLNEVMALALPRQTITDLIAQTEGWAAGVQLAALALRGRADVLAGVSVALDSHHYLLDYLLEEVLNQQPPAFRAFMLRTSVLNRLCADLCAAILETGPDMAHDGPRFSPGEAQSTLEYLESSNLFLVPLDDRRRWYRYHPLFAELLQARLDQELPGEKRHLLNRAGNWYAGQGILSAAVRCALETNDLARVDELARQNVLGLVEHGHLGDLVRQLEHLPPDAFLQYPWLLLAQAWVLLYAGELSLLAEKMVVLFPLAGDDPLLAAHLQVLQGYRSWLMGENKTAIRYATAGYHQLPVGEMEARCMAATILGNALLEEGCLSASESWLDSALTLGGPAGINHIYLFAAVSMANLDKICGRLHRCQALLNEALSCAEQARREGRPLAIQGLAHAALAFQLILQNRLVLAETHARRGLLLARQWDQADALTYCLLAQIQVFTSQDNDSAAQELLVEARHIARDMQSPWFIALVDAQEAGFALHTGRLDLVQAYLDRHNIPADTPLTYPRLTDYRYYVSLLLHRPEPAPALDILAQMETVAHDCGAQVWLIRILVLQVCAHLLAGRAEQAAAILDRALALAAPEEIISPFLGQGPAFAQGLVQAARRGVAADFVSSLLVASDHAASPPPEHLSASLVEPLSARELDVLRQIAAGQSNREVGLSLSLSLPTVKWHASNIYGKLGVKNRTQAVVRARELGLLPAKAQ